MEETKKTNPNGANNTTSDPREQIMWEIYVTKLAGGIDNALASAKEAGYSKDHSRNITLQGWFKERKQHLVRMEMLSTAEKVLKKAIEYKTDKVDEETGELKVNTSLLSIQVGVATTIATTLGKNKGYSTRTELTGAEGGAIKHEVNEIIFKEFNETDSK